MYAPFGAGILIGPRGTFTDGDPFLAGGGAVDLVDLDEVVWTDPPDREEAGSPNVVGAVALLPRSASSTASAGRPSPPTTGVVRPTAPTASAIAGVRCSAPLSVETLPVATFTLDGLPHALAAARLSVEYGIGVRHGCFCAHPYLLRLFDLDDRRGGRLPRPVLAGDRRQIPAR